MFNNYNVKNKVNTKTLIFIMNEIIDLDEVIDVILIQNLEFLKYKS